MVWTTPITWSTGQVVTAPQLNEQVRDNLTYIMSTAQATTAKILDTIYQNTTGVPLMVSVYISNATYGEQILVQNGSTASTSLLVANFPCLAGDGYSRGSVFFIVPPSIYYKITAGGLSTGTPVLANWTEWPL